MTTLLHKLYLVKVYTQGKWYSKIPKNLTTWIMNDPGFGMTRFDLLAVPYMVLLNTFVHGSVSKQLPNV